MIKCNGKDIIPRLNGKELSRVMYNGKPIFANFKVEGFTFTGTNEFITSDIQIYLGNLRGNYYITSFDSNGNLYNPIQLPEITNENAAEDGIYTISKDINGMSIGFNLYYGIGNEMQPVDKNKNYIAKYICDAEVIKINTPEGTVINYSGNSYPFGLNIIQALGKLSLEFNNDNINMNKEYKVDVVIDGVPYENPIYFKTKNNNKLEATNFETIYLDLTATHTFKIEFIYNNNIKSSMSITIIKT